MAEYFAAPTEQSLHDNIIVNPADANEMYFNNTNIMNHHLSRHQSPNNRLMSNNIRENNHYRQIWYHNYDAAAAENDVQRRNRENIARNHNYYNNNNSREIIHNIDNKYQCFIHEAAAEFQSSGNSNDILTENDYAEIATISRNFIPSHRIGGIDSFSALQHLASAAKRLQRVDDKYDDDNNIDLMLDSASDWDDINENVEFNGDLDSNAIDR